MNMSYVWKFIIGDEKCGGIIFAKTEKEARSKLKREYVESGTFAAKDIKEAEIYPLTDDPHYSSPTGVFEAYR